MRKIVKGIKHIVALKNLDKNKTTYNQVYRATDGDVERELDFFFDKTYFSAQKSGDSWDVVLTITASGVPSSMTWTEDCSVIPHVWRSGNYVSPMNPIGLTWFQNPTTSTQYFSYPTQVDFNPTNLEWVPAIKKNEGDVRIYHCVIQNEDSDNAIQASWDSSHAKTLLDGDVYYVAFIFPASGNNSTEKLDEGKVSMAVIDSNNEIIYYKKHYGRVFKTKLSVTV